MRLIEKQANSASRPGIACEQALCLGKKFAFPSPQFPARPKACSQAIQEGIYLG